MDPTKVRKFCLTKIVLSKIGMSKQNKEDQKDINERPLNSRDMADIVAYSIIQTWSRFRVPVGSVVPIR